MRANSLQLQNTELLLTLELDELSPLEWRSGRLVILSFWLIDNVDNFENVSAVHGSNFAPQKWHPHIIEQLQPKAGSAWKVFLLFQENNVERGEVWSWRSLAMEELLWMSIAPARRKRKLIKSRKLIKL